MSYKYYVFKKPYGVLSQFTKEIPTHVTLADFMDIPSHIYPVGRLDKDSEGLLLLTDDNQLKHKLLEPDNRNYKSYLVQVDNEITPEAIEQLETGVTIKHKGKMYKTLPSIVKTIDAPDISPRVPPIRYRKDIPTSWVEMTIYEGKNRQIRKMCAAVGFPVLRLIRHKIKGLTFSDVATGTYRALTSEEIKQLRA